MSDQAAQGVDFSRCKMRAIEFEATAEQRCIHLPDAIPDGTHLRVLLLMEELAVPSAKGEDLKQLLSMLTEGLTEDDLQRPWDVGRGNPEWAT